MRKNETQVFPEESAREVRNKEVARKAAAEGMVLLKNNGVLPLEKGANVSLFGIGAIYTLKGGMGSGDVFERRSVSIYEGMKAAGFQIGNEDWIQDYQRV